MRVLEARDRYFETCGDRHAMTHWLRFRQNRLGEAIIVNWLLQRMAGDTQPLVNLDGSINAGINYTNDTKNFISDWCQRTN